MNECMRNWLRDSEAGRPLFGLEPTFTTRCASSPNGLSDGEAGRGAASVSVTG